MAKKLWGGRFTKKIDKDFFEFQKSISYDYKLVQHDILHSLIHVEALKRAGILNKTEAKNLIIALEKVQKDIENEIKSKKFKPGKFSEDIHTEIQNRVERKLGRKFRSLALKLHALRSRNDQIVFDEKYYCVMKSLDMEGSLLDVNEKLLDLVERNIGKEFIGYTHTRRAQIIHFTDYLLAFYHQFKRDIARIKRFYDNLFIFIGAGALTGSSLSKKNYNDSIKEFLSTIGDWKVKPVEDPLDSVSDRDFIIELLSIISILQMHLSRLAEDLILYSSKEFNLLELPEEFCTGSSLMPHKKNPDFLELVRGNTGRIYGNLFSVLTTMKGLPMAYNRDMQLDKEPLFSSVEIVENELKIMGKFIKGIKLNKNIKLIIESDIPLHATEIAERLVRKYKVPFKRAHDVVGKFIIKLEKKGGKFDAIDDVTLRKIHPNLNKSMIEEIMKPGYASSSKKTFTRKIPKIK